MAIINSYPTITPAGDDLILIVDTSKKNNPTKTATVDSIASLASGATYDLTGQLDGASEYAINLTGSDGSLDKVKLLAGVNITLTDSGSNSVTIDAAGASGMTSWNLTGDNATVSTISNSDTVDIQGGTKITTAATLSDTLTINHDSTTRSDTTSTASPAAGGTFTVIDSVSQDATGHVEAVNVKTVTLPAGGGGGVSWPFQYDAGQSLLVQGENPGATGSLVTTLGVGAGANLTSGGVNTLIGTQAGGSLTSGGNHTALGYRALYNENSTGGGSVAIGSEALRSQNGSGITIFNTAVGANAGVTVTTGNSNVLIGYSSGNTGGIALTTGSRNIIIGTNATSSSSSVNDEITLGNSSVAVLRCQQTSITALSDERDKTDIEDLPYGLDFIDLLQPRKFTWDHRAEIDQDGNEYFSSNKGKKDVGFIAQELQTVDDDWLNLVYDSNPDKLEATYGRLIPVLVKAIKELKARIEQLEN